MMNYRDFLGRVANLFKTKYTNKYPFKNRSMQFEPLEVREMLTAVGFHSAQDIFEGDIAYVRVERSDTTGPLTVRYQVDSGGMNSPVQAKQGVDYETLPGMSGTVGTVSFQDGEKFVDIPVVSFKDNQVEGDEQIRLVLLADNNSTPTYTVAPTQRSSTLVIHDGDTPAKVWVDSIVHGKEGSNSGQFVLKRDNTAGELAVQFTFDYSRSTATFGTDFSIDGMPNSSSTGTVRFLDGSDTAIIDIDIKSDQTIENPETVILRLSNPGRIDNVEQFTLDETRRSGTMILNDRDIVPTVRIDSTVPISNPATDGKIVLRRDNADDDLTVTFTFDTSRSTALYGSDMTISGLPSQYSAGSVTFAKGSLTAEIDVKPVLSVLPETDKTVTIRLSNDDTRYALDETKRETVLLVLGTTPASTSVPQVWIEQGINASEPDSNGRFVLKRNDTSGELSVNFTFDSARSTAAYTSDFTIEGLTGQYSTGAAVFEDGSDTAYIEINVKDDSIVEKSKTIGIKLENASGGSGDPAYTVDETKRYSVVLLNDDDVAPTVWIDSVVHGIEGSRDAKVIVKRSGDTGRLDVTLQRIDGTANTSTDFVNFGTITVSFEDGADTAELTIEIKDDTVVEKTETIIIRLNDPTPVASVPQFQLDQTRREAVVLIEDDDTAANVWIESVEHGTEGGTDGKIVLKRDRIGEPLTVGYTFDSSASSAGMNSDFTINGSGSYSGNVTFEADSYTVEIVLNIQDDAIVEATEFAVVRLNDPAVDSSGMSQYALDPHKRETTVLIHDNETVPFVWVDSTQNAAEGGAGGYFILKRDNVQNELTVTFDLAGTAQNNGDFEYVANSVTFAAGIDSVRVEINAIDDALVEYDLETVTLKLTPRVSGGLDQYHLANSSSKPSYAVVTIGDNDVAPVVWIDDTQNGAEGGNNGFFVLKRDNVQNALTVYYTIGGTAQNNGDYDYLANSVTFAKDSDTVTIPITVRNDTTIEPKFETVTLQLSSRREGDVDQYILESSTAKPSFASITIEDNDAPQEVWIDAVQNGAEGGQNGYFVIKRDSATGNLRVNFGMSGTASNGSDYQYVNSYVDFTDGVDSITVPITVTDDNSVEFDPETVVLTLTPSSSDAHQYTLVNSETYPSTATIFISDNDKTPSVWIASVQNGEEGVQNGYFELKRDVTKGALTVYFNMSGTADNGNDYNYVYYATFADGQDTVFVPITVNDDQAVEAPLETVILRLTPYTSGNLPYYHLENTTDRPMSAVLTIRDNDYVPPTSETAPTVWIETVENGAEGGPNGSFLLRRSSGEGDLTVYYSLSGTAQNNSDYAYRNGQATFLDGEETVLITIDVIDDTTVELLEESVTLTLARRQTAGVDQYILEGTEEHPTVATLTITDNDIAPRVWIYDIQNGTEGGGNGYFRLQRDNTVGAVTIYYSLAGTAANNSDYAYLNYQITFADGEEFVDIPITVLDDALVEYDPETVTLTLNPYSYNEIPVYLLENSASKPSTATLNIFDNDVAPKVWIAEIVNGEEGGANGYFKLMRDNTQNALTVYYTIGGTAQNNVDFDWIGTSVLFEKDVDFVLIPINVRDDAIVEAEYETVTIQLSSRRENNIDQYVLESTETRPSFASITIKDNDSAPLVWIDQVGHAAEEGPVNGFFVVKRDTTAGRLVVDISIGGTAGNVRDYTSINTSTVTFEDGVDTVVIPIAVVDDLIVEYEPETVVLTLRPRIESDAHQYIIANTPDKPSTSTLLIADNDLAPHVWIKKIQDAGEGVQNGLFRIYRNADNLQNDVTVRYSIGGTAVNGSDYSSLSGSVTIAAGQEYVDILINVNDELLAEWDETIILTLNAYRYENIDQYIVDDTEEHPSSARITLYDNDRTVVWIEPGEDAVEGVQDGYFLIKRDNTNNPMTVYYTFERRSSTATKNEDFENLPQMGTNSTFGWVTFDVGVDTIRIPIMTIDDDTLEHPETITLRVRESRNNLTGPGVVLPNYMIDSTQTTATIHVIDNDIKPTVWIDTTQDGTEGLEDGYIRVRRDDARNPLRVNFVINDSSTAILNQHYEYPSGMSEYYRDMGMITFAAGSYYVDILIRPIDNQIVEETKTVSVTLIKTDDNVGGVNTIYDVDTTRHTAVVNIFDNDVQPTIWIDSVQHGTEGVSDGYVRIKRDYTHGEITVRYIFDAARSTAVMGEDFVQLPGMKEGSHFGSITFENNKDYVDIPITVFNDSKIEGTETVYLVLTTGIGKYDLGTDVEAVVNIIDNSAATEIRIDSIQHGEEGVQNGYIRLWRDRTDTRLTVTFELDARASTATLLKDFEKLSGMLHNSNLGSVTFEIGSHYVDIPLYVVDDTQYEAVETVVVRILDGAVGDVGGYRVTGDRTATLTVTDNDAPPEVSVHSIHHAPEGEAGYIRLQRSSSEGELAVSFRFDQGGASAVYDTDFIFTTNYDPVTGIGTVYFADGAEYADIVIYATYDRIAEPDMALPVTILASGDGSYTIDGNSTAVLNILDIGEPELVTPVWNVGVRAPYGYITEREARLGQFTFFRTGITDLSEPLRVYFEIGGTTEYGVDYFEIENVTFDSVLGKWVGFIDIPAESASVTLSITHRYDTIDEGVENIEVTIIAPPAGTEGANAYTVSMPTAFFDIDDLSGVVKDVPIVSMAPTTLEGSMYRVSIIPNGANVTGWEVNWGDGTVQVFDSESLRAEHLYPDGDMNYEVTVKVFTETHIPGTYGPPFSGQSPEFWSFHTNIWTVYGMRDDYAAIVGLTGVAGVPKYMAQAISFGGATDLAQLVRESAAALLNATDPNLNYKLSVEEIIAWVQEAVRTNTCYEVGRMFYDLNRGHHDCWLNPDGGTPPRTEIDTYKYVQPLLVQNVAPTLVISGAPTTEKGVVYTIGLSSEDPGEDTIQYWTINWGDGTESVVQGNPSTATHVYAHGNRLYTITATATDEDGTFSANSIQVTIDGEVQGNWLKLIEDDRFGTEYRANIVVPDQFDALILSIRNLLFDNDSSGRMNDAFEVALLDQNGYSLVPTISTTRDAFLNITEGLAPILASGVSYDAGAGKILVDLSKLAVGTQATLVIRLVNDDGDETTSVEFNPELAFGKSPFSSPSDDVPLENSGYRQIVDYAHLHDVTADIAFQYGTTSFNDSTGIVRAGLDLKNIGYHALMGPILVGVRNISDPSVQVSGYDGMTPDGMYYFDVSHFIFSSADSTFDPDEIIRGLDLQFYNPDHVQFTYDLVVLAHFNTAPTIVSTPESEVGAGKLYEYDAAATDPEKDVLRYELVSGPAGMTIDRNTGKISWQTTPADEGLHAVTIRAYDPYGLWDEQNFTVSVIEDINRPPYFTSAPLTEAFVGSIYHYQATADDPDRDHPLTYRLISAVRTSDGSALPTGHPVTVTTDGLVSWNPPLEYAGETITVQIEVADGRGGTAVQEYLIAVHVDAHNNPPVIITEPPTSISLPALQEGSSSGAVEPGGINLTLQAGEKTIQTVAVNIENQALFAADIVFLVDESGSMEYGHEWIQNMVKSFEEKFAIVGIDVKYALIGYGNDYGNGPGSDNNGRIIYMSNGSAWGNGTEMWDACTQLTTMGGWEDGYAAIDFAIDNLSFRQGAAKHFILLTDEDRDNEDPTIDFDSTLDKLSANNITLHGVIATSYVDGLNQSVLGGRGNGVAFLSDMGGDYIECDGLRVTGASENTVADYVDLIFDPRIDGTCWAIGELNQGDIERSRSFTNAFVDTLVWDILDEIQINLVSSDPGVMVNNITGIQAIKQGKLIFEVEITGDGNAHQFDLEFVSVTHQNSIIGSIPVSVRTGYLYDVDAIDPDGDELVYSLVGETHGATINPNTGVLVWVPTVSGDYEFTVRVIDGRGGEDVQTWIVQVFDPNADNNAPTLDQVENKTLDVGASYEIPVTGHDLDGDVLRYLLVVNPGEGFIYPDELQIDRATGIISWTPTDEQVGTHKIRVQVVDGRGGYATVDFVVTVKQPDWKINHAPEFETDPIISGEVEKTYIYHAKAADPDGHAVTYKLMAAPEGMEIDSKSGIIVWTPKYDQYGEFRVVIRATDGQGGYAHQDFVLTVTTENDPPQIVSAPTGPVGLNVPWSYQVVATDPNGDTLIYALDQGSWARGATIDANGLLQWTPSETGRFDILILVEDGRGGRTMQMFTVDVQRTAPPSITSIPRGPAVVGEEWTYTITSDQDDGTFTITLDEDSIARGMTVDGTTIRWTPGSTADAPIEITLTDQYGGQITQSFTMTVRANVAPSQPPSITSKPLGPAYVGEQWSYQVVATDPENDAITYYLVGEDGGKTELIDGFLLWTPSAAGSQRFTVRAEDASGSWTEQSFTLTATVKPSTNSPPAITSIPLGPATVSEQYEYQVIAHDPDNDNLTYSVDTNSASKGVQIDENGLLTWTPVTSGKQNITVTVRDSAGNTVTQTFEMVVDPQPVVSQPPTILSKPAGPAYIGEEWSYTVEAQDPEQETGMTYWLIGLNGQKTKIDATSRTVTWTPDEVGEKTFTIRVEDVHGFWTEQTFTIAAIEVANNPPVINSVPTGPAFVGERYSYQIAAYDPDGDPIHYGLDQDSIDRGMAIRSDGVLIWTPDTAGDYEIQVIVTDSRGDACIQTFTLTVAWPEADPPTITSTPTGPAYVDQEWSYQITATDSIGGGIVYTTVDTDGSVLSTLTDGLLTWDPTAEGTQTFIVRATDDAGRWSEQTFTIRAITRPVQVDPPSISSEPTGPAFLDEEYVYQVEAATQDGSDPVFTLDQDSIDRNMTIDANGRLSWTPDTAGSFEVSVTVEDASGAWVIQTFTLNVVERTVKKVPPTITSEPGGPAYLNREWTYTVDANLNGVTTGITISFLAEDGTLIEQLNPLDPTVRWTPDTEGTYTFIIRAEGPDGAFQDQRFTLTVVAAPVPVKSPIFTSVPTGPAYTGEMYEYQVTAKTFDGTKPIYTLDQASTDRGIRIDADGLLTWIPGSGDYYPITITVSDGLGQSITQEFTLTVMARPVTTVPPVITSKPVGPAYLGEAWNYALTATAADGGAVRFWLMYQEGDKNREVIDGQFSQVWTSTGAKTLIFRAEDANGAWVEQRFTLQVVERVEATNDSPVIYSIPTEQVRLDKQYQYQIVAHDPNGESLNYTLLQGPQGASINSSGVLYWNPGATGSYDFVIAVSDGANDPVTQSFTVTVLPPVTTNSAPYITSIPVGPAMKDREFQYQATAEDLDGDAIRWSIDEDSFNRGVRIDADTGLLTWTPQAAGTYRIIVYAGDGKETVSQSFSLPVSNNAPPVITGLPDASGTVGQQYRSKIEAEDPNGDVLRYSIENAPDGLTVGADGTLTWNTPVAGRYTITVVVTDSEEATASRQFQLRVVDPNVVNVAPEFSNTLPSSIPSNLPFAFQFTATDAEADYLTFKLGGAAPSGMVLSSGGWLEWKEPVVGQHTITVELTDGTNTVTRTFTLNVVAQRANNPPTFTSVPLTNLMVGQKYTYKPTGTDPDGDTVSFTLVSGPAGMKMNENGIIEWTPTKNDAGKDISMTVRILDSYGVGVDQTVKLVVRSVALPPEIKQEPMPVAVVGKEYVYTIPATDPQGQKLRFELSGTVPNGLTLDRDTGVIRWTPTGEGVFPIVVNVFNESGYGIAAQFPIQVYTVAPNIKPYFASIQSHAIEAGLPWQYQLDCVDLDGDTLTYSIVSGAPGLSIDTATGLMQWTPDASQRDQSFQIKVRVSDGDKSDDATFTINVTPPNTTPTLQPILDQNVTAGSQFQYRAAGTDPDYYDTLTYSLNQAALDLGMTIDAKTGQINWNPARSQISATSYTIVVSVTDGRSAPVSQSFKVKVVEDTQAPIVTITATPPKTSAGKTVTITVKATDNVGVVSTTLLLVSVRKPDGTVNTINKEITLTNGIASYTLADDEFGILTFAASAVDAQGNASAVVTTTVQAIDQTDKTRPSVVISSPSQGTKLDGPADIIGTVTDDKDGVNWTLKAYSLETGQEVLISSGTGNTSGVLGRFDTTMLRNGTWQIVLEAVDVGGNVGEKYFNVEVEGYYKVGNFNMTFTDFDFQLGGIPITITRTYDTLNANVKGDFGYGWTLDILQYKLMVDYGDGNLVEPNPYRAFQDGDKIVFQLPDGSKEGFVFQAQGGGSSSGGGLGGLGGLFGGIGGGGLMYTPSFIPMVGNKSELIYDNSQYLMASGYGLGYEDWLGTGISYSPFNGFFGGLSIKLRNGTVLDFDPNSGNLVSAMDKTGSGVTISSNKIEHTSGKGVTFQRNAQGFISSITGPDGSKITFGYDSKGNLVSVTDQSGATTQFTYLDDPKAPEHYLDTIVDSLGRPAARTEYDESGRIKKVTDADGKTIEYEFDTESQIQKVTDQMGNTTIIQNDNRGNVIREVSAEGDTTLRSYDASGNVLKETKVVLHNGKEIEMTTSYTYDSYGNKLTETDARGNVTRYTYDQYGQVTSTSTGDTATTTNYDSYTGLPTSSVDANGNRTNYGYDSKGNMTALVNSEGVQLIDAKYNKYGEVTEMKSTNGRTTYMEYDANGDCIASWYEEDGYRIIDRTFYDDSRRVIGRERVMIDLLRRTGEVVLSSSQTEYNKAGQVIRTIDNNGMETLYTYDVRGQQTQVRSQSQGSDGQIFWTVQKTVYDAAGRVTYSCSYTEGTSLTKIFGSHTAYDGDGRNILSEQLLGLVIEIGTNGNSFVKTRGTVQASSSTSYNSAGWIISSTDTYGLKTEYTYNVFGETTQTRRQLTGGGWMVSETVYDAKGRVIFSTDSHLEGSSDPIYGTKTLYDEKGRSVGSIRFYGCNVAIDTAGTSSIVTAGTEVYRTSTEYDSKGRVKSSTDAYGNVTTYEYDKLDRQIAVNYSTGQRSETVYNTAGQVEKTISNIKKNVDGTFDYSDAVTTVNTYNMYGQVVKTVTDGRIVEYEYDEQGRQIATIDHPTESGVRHRSESVYDDLGRLVISRTNVKVLADNTIDRSEAQELKYVYDAHGNVVKTIFADGTSISAKYNEQGQKISETNQLGQTRHFEYDIKGRLIAVVLPAVKDSTTGKMVAPRYEYQYDVYGRQTLLRDPNGFETRFEYDSFGNQISRTLPLGFGADGVQGTADDSAVPTGDFTERSIYDDNGRLFMQISFEGVITTFSYDSRGRLLQKFFWKDLTAYAEGTAPPKETWTYTYDSQGRVISINQNGRKTETTYDEQGRTTSIKTPEGTVSYEYDKFGRQTRVSSNKGDDVRYTYDIFGRLETVTDATTGNVTKYEYDLVGNLAKTTTNTGETKLVTTYQYDNMNRLVKQTNFVDANNNGVFDAGEGVSQFGYTLDAQGRKTRADETFWIEGQAKQNRIDWTYDEAGRLIREYFDHYDDTLDQTLAFTYDLTGNRLLQTVDKGNDGTIDQVFAYLYDANDRLIDELFDGQNDGVFEKATRYGYDHTQQISKTVSENGKKTSESIFEYDVQGRMSVVTITTYDGEERVLRQERTSYKYGADGIRVSALHEIDSNGDGQYESKKLTEYLNDSKSITGYSQVLRQTDYDADGNIEQTISNIIGHGRISQKTVKNGVESELWFSFDGHGSTRVLLDVAGAVAQLFAYDAYGQAIGFNPADALTEFLFSGEQFDAKIGQQYLRARYYDPATGRFNRNDPFFGNLNDPQSLHNYLYCHADPVNGVDPTGQFFWPIVALGAIIGGVAGYWHYGWAGVVPGVVGGALIGTGVGAIGLAATSSIGLLGGWLTYTGGLIAGFLGALALHSPNNISRQLASAYVFRATLGATIIGQIYTRGGDYEHVLMDDGSMLKSIDQNRQRWLFGYAMKYCNVTPNSNFYQRIEIDEYTYAGAITPYLPSELKPFMDSWWVSGMSGIKVKGSYEIKVEKNGIEYKYSIRNMDLHWAGWDHIDANPVTEWDHGNYVKWVIEGTVGVIGDVILGADYPLSVYAYEYEPNVYTGYYSDPTQ